MPQRKSGVERKRCYGAAKTRQLLGNAGALSKDLKRRGFKFVGSTIMYAFMQAVGMVNDHARDCFRRKALAR